MLRIVLRNLAGISLNIWMTQWLCLIQSQSPQSHSHAQEENRGFCRFLISFLVPGVNGNEGELCFICNSVSRRPRRKTVFNWHVSIDSIANYTTHLSSLWDLPGAPFTRSHYLNTEENFTPSFLKKNPGTRVVFFNRFRTHTSVPIEYEYLSKQVIPLSTC